MHFNLALISIVLGTAAGHATLGPLDSSQAILQKRAGQYRNQGNAQPKLVPVQANSCGTGKLRKRGACYSAPGSSDPKTHRGQRAALRAPSSPSTSQNTGQSGTPAVSPLSTDTRSSDANVASSSKPRLPLDRGTPPTIGSPYTAITGGNRNDYHRLRMKVENDGHLRELGTTPEPGEASSTRSVKGFGDLRRIARQSQKSDSVAGEMVTNKLGVGTGSIRAERVRADISTTGSSKSIVKVRDPSRNHYPNGKHTERVEGEMTKVFHGQAANGQLAKIRVKSTGQSSAYFQGTPEW